MASQRPAICNHCKGRFQNNSDLIHHLYEVVNEQGKAIWNSRVKLGKVLNSSTDLLETDRVINEVLIDLGGAYGVEKPMEQVKE